MDTPSKDRFAHRPSKAAAPHTPEVDGARTTRTVRCWPYLRLMFGVMLIMGYLTGFIAWHLASGDMPDHSARRLLAAGIGVAAFATATVWLALSLRSRVITSPTGIEVVHAVSRRPIPWAKIERVCLNPGVRHWQLQVCVDGVPVIAMSCPSRWTKPQLGPGLLPGYDTVQAATPAGLIGPFTDIRAEWRRRK